MLSRRLYSMRFKVPVFSIATMYTNLKTCLFTAINALDVVKTIGLTIKQKGKSLLYSSFPLLNFLLLDVYEFEIRRNRLSIFHYYMNINN